MKALREQFKDLLESLSASYSAGRNTPDAFGDACNDMISIYGEDSDIVRELELICTGLKNNINIEVLLQDFADRSGLDDVASFASVFEVCNRQGGDLKRVVNQTRDVIGDKMEIEMEIDTMVAGNKNELNIMMFMPLLIVGMMKGMGLSSVGTNTPVNIMVKVVCIGVFALAYVMGSKITDIKI
jgi:tight adherence protein B